MKVGGGLNYVAGPMGAGKSLYGVRSVVRYITAGRYAVTNVELRPEAFDLMARHFARLGSERKRAKLAASYRAHYVYETNLQEAMRYRLPGEGEARGLFVWDETHNDLNNRRWKDDGRTEILEWATQLRKLGFVGFLLSQHQDNTDAALRRVCNFVVRLQNQREQTRMMGIRVTPWPLFLAAWYPSNTPISMVKRASPMKVERYFLDWHRHLYDTFGLYHGLVDDGLDDGLVRLPAGGLGRALPEALPRASGEASGAASDALTAAASPVGGLSLG